MVLKFIKGLFKKDPKLSPEEVLAALEAKVSILEAPAVRFRKASLATRTKFGGRPLVDNSDFSWPRSDGKPMAFLAQIDLAELAKIHRYDWLNDRGVILFFYDVIEMPWGFDPKDRGKWSVVFQSDPHHVVDLPDDLAPEATLPEINAEAYLAQVLPSHEHPSFEALSLTEQEIEAYIERFLETDEPAHQVGGFPAAIQGDNMQQEAQLVSHGIYIGDGNPDNSEQIEQLKPGSSNWELLLQLDTDDDLGVMWGDSGRIYFWVEKQKALANEFDDSWLVLQCF